MPPSTFVNSLFRRIGSLPEGLFRQFLAEKHFLREASFSCYESVTMTVTTDQGVKVKCSMPFKEMEEIAEHILRNYPQGIFQIRNCSTGLLDAIVRLKPDQLRDYMSMYVVYVIQHPFYTAIGDPTSFRSNYLCCSSAQTLNL